MKKEACRKNIAATAWEGSPVGIEDWLKRYVFWSQLAKPSGPQGELVGRLMTAYNAQAHDFTLAQMNLEPEDRVLEIGFGGGALVQKVIEHAPRTTVRGVDLSETMIRQARKRNAAAIREGRVELRYGGVSALPYEDESFDKALSVHSIYFWPEPVSDLKEVLRVLEPGGLILVTLDPSELVSPAHSGGTGYLRWDGEALLALIETAGFVRTGIVNSEGNRLICGLGRKPNERE